MLPNNPAPAGRGTYVAMPETDVQPSRRARWVGLWSVRGIATRFAIPALRWSPEPCPRIVGVLLDRKRLVVEVECA